MRRLFVVALALAVLTGCPKTTPSPPARPAERTSPVRVEPDVPAEFQGTRVGPLLGSLFVSDDVLVSHDAEVDIPRAPLPGPLTPPILPPAKVVPRESSVRIEVTLANDSNRALGLKQDFAFQNDWLFLVTVTDEGGREVFRHEQGLEGLAGWRAAEIKQFEASWPVSADMAGHYLVSVEFGFGGQLTAATRLR